MRDLTLVRSRPWSDVWRVEAGEGRWWLKVNGAGTTYEPRLLQQLAGLGSALVPGCLVHPDQPWSLIEDAGQPLTELDPALPRAEQVELWCTLLADYAELQRTAAARGRPDLGLPDFSPEQLPSRLDEVLADQAWFSRRAAPDLTAEQLDRIGRTGAALQAAAQQLVGGVACSVQHDDLHAGNVLVESAGSGPRPRARLIDWGDAVWAHPFGTLLVTLRSLASAWSVAVDDPVLRRVRDAYLEPWRDRGESAAELVDQVDLAVRTGGLTRAAGWIRALGTVEAAMQADFADAPGSWMLTLVESLEVPGAPRLG